MPILWITWLLFSPVIILLIAYNKEVTFLSKYVKNFP